MGAKKNNNNRKLPWVGIFLRNTDFLYRIGMFSNLHLPTGAWDSVLVGVLLWSTIQQQEEDFWNI